MTRNERHADLESPATYAAAFDAMLDIDDDLLVLAHALSFVHVANNCQAQQASKRQAYGIQVTTQRDRESSTHHLEPWVELQRDCRSRDGPLSYE